MDQDVEDRIPGERAEISTSRGVDTNPVLKRGAVAVAIIAFVGFALWSTTGKKGREDNVQPERIVIRQTTPFEAAKEKVEPEQPVPEIKLPTPVEQPVTEEKDEMLDSARRAPVMAFSGGNKNRKDGSESASYYSSDNENFVSLDNKVTVQNRQNNEQDRFDGLLRPTRLEGSRAGTLGNRNFTVAMGTSIPCILETALASDQPGFTTCVINRDVLSDNGRVVLMEKGTQVVGEYRGGLQRGQTRLFILWNRAKTPKGVIVTLASPATDRLGRAGFDGYVDTHWWERFGGALLLSVVGDATNYANSRLRDSDVDAQKTTSASQQAAAIAIEQSINIPPTLNKHQGEPVSIFVARDLDFSGIYSLRVIEPKNRVFDRAALGGFRATINAPDEIGREMSLRQDSVVVSELLKPFSTFLQDGTLFEIIVNRPGQVLTEGLGGWRTHEMPELSFEKLMRLTRAVASFSNQSIDEKHPILSAALPGGERIQIVIPPATIKDSVSITIRKPSSIDFSLDDLEDKGFFQGACAAKSISSPQDEELSETYRSGRFKDFLRQAVIARKNIIISGATGSAKTTLSKALIKHIPENERVISIEDTPELVIPQPNHVRLFYSKGGQGLSSAGPKELLESCLRMRPDRIMLQELRDGTAFYYIRNVNSGHPGSITTIHANSAELAFEQLVLLVKESEGGAGLDRADIFAFLKASIDIVAQCRRDKGEFRLSEVYFRGAPRAKD